MKFVVSNLKLGDSISGRVEELLPGGDLLIAFSGDLLRVHNETRRPFKTGDRVTLIVKAIRPLRFQFVDDRGSQKKKGQLNVSV
jgi:hypothetical protein